MEGKFAHGTATLAKTTVIFCVFCFKVLVFTLIVNLENRNASASEQVCSEKITLSYNLLYFTNHSTICFVPCSNMLEALNH